MLRSGSQWLRLWRIWRVLRRHGVDQAWGWRAGRQFDAPLGARIRAALEELGPVFIKFGQALSTRPDLLPPDIAAELALLQDAVTPFPGAEAVALVERELGMPVAQAYAEFDIEPLASASVAQVHTARLHGEEGEPGLEVVVKVLRPGIHERVARDVALLHFLAGLAERLRPELSRRLRPREVVAEYEKVITDELDLLREAANASQLRRNWLGSELIYHPIVFWQHTRASVLTLERLHGLPVDEIAQLRELGADFSVLAERGVEIFFTQTFVHNFFHADMHPGNVYVDPANPAAPRYLALDFGIVGSLTPADQRYLAENFLAFFNQDYRRVAELHIESGWVPRETRLDEFEGAIRAVCEPIFDKPLKDISFGLVLMRLFAVARRFEMRVQPQLVLLQKTLLNIEGLGRQLYPELDLMRTAKPILERWMRERLSPRFAFERVKPQLPALADALPALLQRLGEEPATARLAREVAELRAEQRRQAATQGWVLAGSAALVGVAISLGLDNLAPLRVGGLPLSACVFAVVAAWCGLRAWRAGRA